MLNLFFIAVGLNELTKVTLVNGKKAERIVAIKIKHHHQGHEQTVIIHPSSKLKKTQPNLTHAV